MRKIILYLLILLLSSACSDAGENKDKSKDTVKAKSTIEKVKESTTQREKRKVTGFDFTRYEIGKGKIGNIHVGQTLKEVKSELAGLKRERKIADDFAIDGGNNVNLYKYKGEPILATVLTYDSDTIMALVALHPNLKAKNGVHPKMSLDKLIEKYPNNLFYQNLLFGGEEMDDKENNWTFVFKTTDKNQIGDYPDIESPSKAKSLNHNLDWIIIY